MRAIHIVRTPHQKKCVAARRSEANVEILRECLTYAAGVSESILTIGACPLSGNAVKHFSSCFQQLRRTPFSPGKGRRWPRGRMRGFSLFMSLTNTSQRYLSGVGLAAAPLYREIMVQRQTKCAEEDRSLNREWTRRHANSGGEKCGCISNDSSNSGL